MVRVLLHIYIGHLLVLHMLLGIHVLVWLLVSMVMVLLVLSAVSSLIELVLLVWLSHHLLLWLERDLLLLILIDEGLLLLHLSLFLRYESWSTWFESARGRL
jgi:hypothetical protein